MAYRDDVDLEFLSKVTSEDLDPLVKVLTHDPSDGKKRLTEELTSTREYIRHEPDHKLYWKQIAAELQCFGANTLGTVFRRGKGVLYREILTDVCDNMKANYNKKSEISKIESELLTKVLEKAWENMQPKERDKMLRGLKFSMPTFNIAGGIGAIQGVVSLKNMTAYRLAGIAAVFAVGPIVAGAAIAGGSMLATIAPRLFGLNPLLIVPTSALSVWQVTGAAYRVTRPACVLVAALRKKYEMSAEEVAKLAKADELAQKMGAVIEEYQKSDKKLMGLYLLTRECVRELSLSLTEEDIKGIIFDIGGDARQRVERLIQENPPAYNFDGVVKHAVQFCGCAKSDLETIFSWVSQEDSADNEIATNLKSRLHEVIQGL
jgi:Uncharacterized protein conserved in bacteria